MKKINLLYLLGLLFVVLGFASCSDNEDGDADVSKLIGVWHPVHAEGYDVAGGQKETWNKDIDVTVDGYARVEFLADGTAKSYMYRADNDSWELVFTASYRLKGDLLTLFDSEGVGDEATIVSLTSTQLVMETKYNEGEDGEYCDKITYEKVK